VKDRHLQIRYEEFVSNPELVMRRVTAHVGETGDDCVAQFHELDDPIYPSVQRPVSDKSMGKWKHVLTNETRQIANEVTGELPVELGYVNSQNWFF